MPGPELDSRRTVPLSHSLMREIVLGAKETPKKLENFLKKEFPIGYVRKLFRKNGVRVNGRRARENDLVGADDRIQLYIPFEAAKKAPRQAAQEQPKKVAKIQRKAAKTKAVRRARQRRRA